MARRTQLGLAWIVATLGVTTLTACAGNPIGPGGGATSPTGTDACLAVSPAPPVNDVATPGPTAGQERGAGRVTFSFSGTIDRVGSCPFGLGVAPGTRLSGRFTFSTTARPTPSFQPERVDYFGVSAEVTVGAETIRANDPALAKIQIHDGPPSGDSYSVIVEGGFNMGTIAGRRIERFVWVVSGGPALFSDLSLPEDPRFFGPRLGSRVCLGECFTRSTLEGTIHDLWAVE